MGCPSPWLGERRRDEPPRCFAARRYFVETHRPPCCDRFDFAVALAFLALGLVSLAANYFFASQPESRRKIRVIFWEPWSAWALR